MKSWENEIKKLPISPQRLEEKYKCEELLKVEIHKLEDDLRESRLRLKSIRLSKKEFNTIFGHYLVPKDYKGQFHFMEIPVEVK